MTSIDTKTLIDLFNGLKVDINNKYLNEKKYQKPNATEIKKIKGILSLINEMSLTMLYDILKKCTIKKAKKKSDSDTDPSSEGEGEEEIPSEVSEEKDEVEENEIPMFNIDGFSQLVDDLIKKIYNELLNEEEYKELNKTEIKKIMKALTDFNQISVSTLIEINKKCIGKKEKKEKSSTPNAMDKQNEVEDFVPKFMGSKGFDVRPEFLGGASMSSVGCLVIISFIWT